MESSIDLSLLIVAVTKLPFGASFIVLSGHPQVVRVGGPEDKRSFADKIDYIERSNWAIFTNLGAVFRDLIRGVAIHDKLNQEDLSKLVFLFSDM
ncbi:Hypothetical predicted protein [Lecanosticta acicola]|uniref:DUF7788 domain-containing protein n=1 Tax=Lecanosticta acicola TaxID=111012 RepID=A0AAI9E9S5_9PEZI|nr:Hypothetical predicted protein [Lecanosticta acicola]